MPKGPQGQKRPADVIGAAIRVARIATGEEDDDAAAKTVEPRGVAGANARKKALTPERRKIIAQRAAKARWARDQEVGQD